MKIPIGGSFGNGMLAMIQRNGAMLRGVGYFNTRTEYLKASKKVHLEDYKKATPEQLQKIRILYKEAKRQAVLKKIVVMIIAMGLTVTLLYALIYWMRMVFGF